MTFKSASLFTYQPRTYRQHSKNKRVTFEVIVGETDLLISAVLNLEKKARDLVYRYRHDIESIISTNPKFGSSLSPIAVASNSPRIILEMAAASEKAGVGPMAAVAGAIAQRVGEGLLKDSNEIIVENGGDIFLHVLEDINMAVYAADSPLSMRVGLKLPASAMPVAVCTSSGTIGHSLSFGKADAVCVVSPNAALADAVATATANRVQTPADIAPAIEFACKIENITGTLIIVGDKLGAGGKIELIPL